MRLILALRAALAAFVASWRGAAPALGPYRRLYQSKCHDELCLSCGQTIRAVEADRIDAWIEAQRDLTPADMRAAEARRQNVIVEPPDVPDTPPGRPYFD